MLYIYVFFIPFLSTQESPEPGRSSIYHSLVVNTSKEMMCFSDFPMPADYPNYMHNSQLLHYFRLYADHFDLLRCIHFRVTAPKPSHSPPHRLPTVHVCFCVNVYIPQTTVRSITQRPDMCVSGQWEVVTINREGEEEKHIFDAVLVCSGHYTHPALPLSDFNGEQRVTVSFL